MRQSPAVALVVSLGGFLTVVNLACAQPWARTDAPPQVWKSLACSADGALMVAASNVRGIGINVIPPVIYAIYVSTNAGAHWTQTSAGSNNWFSVACSADGTKLVAVASLYGPTGGRGDGLIYTSPDSGLTWMATSAPSNNWSAVASSADGMKLVAVAATVADNAVTDYVGDGGIYCSADAGATWTRTTAPSNNWTSVVSSADGAKLLAASASHYDYTLQHYVGDGVIYRSLDSGVTWIKTGAPSGSWTSVASSADGTRLLAAAGYPDNPRPIYVSTDSGATWTPTSSPSSQWSSVACSADGVTMFAAAGDGGFIYTSTDSGATWKPAGPYSSRWAAVVCSADGQRIAAADQNGLLCTWPYAGRWRGSDVPPSAWNSVACSADGTKLVAASYTDTSGRGLIYTSGDSGASWMPTSALPNYWKAVSSSADGTKLTAAAWPELNDSGDGLIYTSSDSGVSWAPTTAPANWWISVASSQDGARLVAASATPRSYGLPKYYGDGLIYTSTDSGSTWAATSAPINDWTSVASSADGMILVAVAGMNVDIPGDGLIYTSSDAGANWTSTAAPKNYWTSVACSADGVRLVAVPAYFAGGDSLICTSVDSGATWTPTTASANPNVWSSVACSGDGSRIMVTGLWGGIYGSTNSGATWQRAGEPAAHCSCVAISGDGSCVVAIAEGDPAIYVLRSPAPVPPLPSSPRLRIDCAGSNIGLSWLVPSTPFVLQETADLGAPNWTDVPTCPSLDCTNLHHRMTLQGSVNGRFYRLKQQ